MIVSVFQPREQEAAEQESVDESSTECRIYNYAYKEYLHATASNGGGRRSVRLSSSNGYETKTLAGLFRPSPLTHFSDKDPAGVWHLERLSHDDDDENNNLFYLRNKKYPNEYLRASDSFFERLFKHDREVFLDRMTFDGRDRDAQSFVWRLEQVPPNTHLLYVRNVKTGLSLRAQEFFAAVNNKIFDTNKLVLVNLSHMKPQQTEQFEWVLRCRDTDQADSEDEY